MALYAFDGTWNEDQPDARRDTNVIKFKDAYLETGFYREGVGTRFGPFGRLIGGMTGAGGHERIEEGLEALRENFGKGDTTVDIIGFSRGAALAVHFANKVAEGVRGLPGPQPVRFLGIWDIVPSFGIPGDDIDLFWDLGMPSTTAHCFHAMALDERRVMFPLHRLTPQGSPSVSDRLAEVWFRGVHSDVGGGNMNVRLSSIALNWMFQNALRSGVRLKPGDITANQALMDPNTPNSRHNIELARLDLIREHHRSIRGTDVVHSSVATRAGRDHNNPPAVLARMSDDGSMAGAAIQA